MNKDTETEHLPSEKKRKVTKKNAGGQQATIKRVRGIRGMLADVKEMPLDILFEIFSRLNPIDLVNLTRTSKDLRAIFTSRSSISVWKAARANIIPTMPDCPDDLSEPQYADLAFGKGCHYCGRNLATIHTAWSARRRICKKCIDKHCSLNYPYRYINETAGFKNYVPEIKVTSQKSSTHYFVEFAALWDETLDNIADPEEKASWRISKLKERRAIRDHAWLCATWVKEYAEYQQFLIEQLATKQLDNIAERVAYLGWNEEVLKMLPSEEKFEEQLEVRKMCRKELTDRILVRLDAQINEYMEIVKERRLKRERLAFLKDRLPILQKVHNDHLLTFTTTERYWYPMASELFLYEPKIQDIVNDTSSTLESMKERLMLTLPEIYPDAINQLIRRIDDQLLEVIIASRPGELIDRETVFGLATTLFRCVNCERLCTKRILRYNEVVLHSCTRTSDFPAECQDGYFIKTLTNERYRSHRHGPLTVSNAALTFVPILAKLCGLDPHTATTQMMDDLDPVFECIPCASQEFGRATLTWLGAVFHFHSQTHKVGSVKLERLNENEEDVARKRIVEMQERAMASTSTYSSNRLLQCAHCSQYGTKDMLIKHVKSAHGTESPTNKDIMLKVDANHIPGTFYMWPPRKPE
ncbi:hypothetical protein BJ912DRAFT_1146553 [Pholiota molesta]|nr:hypothetical protein BJ912DRAFT_1146553 [Pholiota molesta]